jgi:hypothetical protein
MEAALASSAISYDCADCVPLPSSVPPSFRVAVVASVAGFRDSCGNVPLDLCVPVRAGSGATQCIGALTSRVLSHVNGVHSLHEIAERTDLSLSDAIAACLDLVALGVVHVSMPPDAEEVSQ